MKRLHVHVSVDDLAQSVQFYSTLFAAEPAVTKGDYAKWMLDDPRVNFAISTRSGGSGLDHLGIQPARRVVGNLPDDGRKHRLWRQRRPGRDSHYSGRLLHP